ncbi:xylulokinase [Spirochaetia bacterium]|nr:xylulokinase [Spirochaetia bacterium]
MILAIDIGTSTYKAALFGTNGSIGRIFTAPLAISIGGASRHETNPEGWLRAFENVLSRMGPVNTVDTIVISGNGPTLVPVTGEPAVSQAGLSLESGTARLWLDRRAGQEAKTVSALEGAFVDPSFFLPKALAVKNREPELYQKTRYFLSTPEYLSYALTGAARIIFPSEGFERWFWDDQVLEGAGLDKGKFPPFIFPGEVVGTLLPAVASHFGFNERVRVIAGGPDFFVSILGTGTTAPGDACDRGGTSEGINVCTINRITDKRLMSYGHPIGPFWNLSGIISTSGKAIAWGRELLGIEHLPHAAFYELAGNAGAGTPLFLPYLSGERAPIWDPAARGVFSGLSLSTGRAEIARSIAEGICFAIRDVVEVMEEAGAPVRELRVTGGPAESEFLNQLKADISGRPVLLPAIKEAELLGLAVIGAAAQGKYASLKEAAGDMVRIERTFIPDPDKGRRYAESFESYRGLYRSLKPHFERGT